MVKKAKSLLLKNKNKKKITEEQPAEVKQKEKEDIEEELFDVQEEKKPLRSRHRIAKTQKDIETLKEINSNTGVIYIGHLPWGFQEEGLKKYFQQFGAISRIIVPRSMKTGRVKGYAFIEFESRETADIAAKTMNNYILFDKILHCSTVEDRSKYDLIFKRWKRKFKFVDKYQKYVQEKNKAKTDDEVKSQIQLMLDKEDRKRTKLKEIGIKYDFPGFRAIIDKYRKSTQEMNAKPKKKTQKGKIKQK